MALTTENIVIPANPNDSSATVGKDFLLFAGTGSTMDAVTWNLVGGQKNSKLTQKADSIDVSDKTTGGYKATLPGLKSWSFDLSGLVLLQDTGVNVLKTAYREGKVVPLKFQYPDKTYDIGWAAVTEFSYDVPHDGAASLSGTLEGNGGLESNPAPTEASGE